MALAKVVTERCATFRYNETTNDRILLDRIVNSHGPPITLADVKDMQLVGPPEISAALRTRFENKHGLSLEDGDTCEAIQSEVVDLTNLSTLFEPV